MLEGQKEAVAQATGKIQDAAGNLLESSNSQVKGKASQVADRARQTYIDAADQLRDTTRDTPIKALAIAGVVGFVIAALWSRK